MELKLEQVCAIICAFNEEKTIGEVVRRAKPLVGEVIVIDDGSYDGTASQARSNGANVISHHSNLGKGAALKTGFEYCICGTNYHAAITLDADLQHLPEEIPRFINALKVVDVVIGKRDFNDAAVPVHRRIANNTYSAILSWASNRRVYDPENGFRGFRFGALSKLYGRIKTQGFTYESRLLLEVLKSEYKLGWVPISTIYIPDRKSKINLLKHFRQSTGVALDVVINRVSLK